jgi:zinc finger protein
MTTPGTTGTSLEGPFCHEASSTELDLLEIEHCYCPSCGGGNGVSKLLPTKVPGFREIIVVSLSCEECNFRNNEVTFTGEIQPLGTQIVLTLQSKDDLNRQILKSDFATVFLPSLSDLEIPPNAQRGVLTTIEGMLLRVRGDLSSLQPESLMVGDVDNFHRCQSVIDRIQRITGTQCHHTGDCDDDDGMELLFPFQLVLDDPAGNSYIESQHPPNPDPYIKIVRYSRTPAQDLALGLQPSRVAIGERTIQSDNPHQTNLVNTSSSSSIPVVKVQEDLCHSIGLKEDLRGRLLGRTEVLKFPTECVSCHHLAETNMSVTDIPHFKEIILMSFVCDQCGYRSSEIKGGGAIPRYGSRITVSVSCLADLDRDVLKSDTAGIEIPEIDLYLQEGGHNGVYTTIEGLLVKMMGQLKIANPFGIGDSAVKHHLSNDGHDFSAPDSSHGRFMALLQSLEDMSKGQTLPFTLIITDPLSNSFVGPIPADAVALSRKAEQDGNKDCYYSYVDPCISLEEVERTYEQNEALGLNDIKTEGYCKDL